MNRFDARSFRTFGIAATAAAITATGLLATGLLLPVAAHAQAAQVLKVKAVENPNGTVYKFDGVPASLKGGNIQIELTNPGKEPHDLQIVRVEGLHTIIEVMKVIGSDSEPVPGWMHADGGVGTVAPGGVGKATVNLGPGKYFFICTEENQKTHAAHAAGGMTVNVTVAGAKAAALPSGATATITAKEYGFETKGLKPGKNLVQFNNAGKELHHFAMFPIATGKTITDVKSFLSATTPPAGQPPVDFEKSVSASVIEKSEGGELTEITLQAGRYAMLCFISDRAGGPPHFMKGMLTEVVIK